MDTADHTQIIHRTDVGMIERGGGPPLAEETGSGFGGGVREVRYLQGNVAVDLSGMRQVDRTHAAPARRFDDTITPELLRHPARSRRKVVGRRVPGGRGVARGDAGGLLALAPQLCDLLGEAAG